MERDKLKQIIIDSIYETIKNINGKEIDQVLDGDILLEIDSLVGFNLLLMLEDKLNISLPEDFLSSENCSSLNKIVDTFMGTSLQEG